MSRSIREWQEYIHTWARGKGWYDGYEPAGEPGGRNIPEMLALVHSEISEALEEWRDPNASLDGTYKALGGDPCGFGLELADVMVRILDLAEYCGIDLEKMMDMKMQWNEQRPYRHGGKRA